MDSNTKRKHIPQWPPFKQPYQRVDSAENLTLTPVPRTGTTQRSGLPTATLFSPGLNNAAAYTPDPMGATPTAFLSSPSKSISTGRKRWSVPGWKCGARLALACAVTVLVTNICMAVIIVTTGMSMTGTPGIYMVYEGSCSKTQHKNTFAHLGLNIVATALLASSNYCMQLLTSPSRREVDKAHAKQKWLDIGVASIRNLGSLSKKKVVLWWLLGLSSIPLHLMYNSVFYSALVTNNYSVLYVSQDFIQGAAYNHTAFPDTSDLNVTDVQVRAKQFDVLKNEDCIRAYAKDFVEDRRNVIVVVKDPPANQGSLFKITDNEFPAIITPKYDAFSWICDSPGVVNQTGSCCKNEYGFVPCSKIVPKLLDMADEWSTGGFEVDHCLAESVESLCHLHFSLILMAVVLCFNVLKVIAMAYVAFRLAEAPLVTVGDAVQSFLLTPDRITEGMSLSSHKSIVASSKLGFSSMPMYYNPRPHRFYEAPSRRQWTFLLALFAIIGTGTAVCLTLGIEDLTGDNTIGTAFSIGLGNVVAENLVMSWNLPGYGDTSIAVSTLIANTPQALFSFLYVCYNNLFIIMLLSYELSRFSITSGRGRKYLRVNDPRGSQRSPHFLILPAKYGIPLLAGSGLLHWLVSQSIFLANITIVPRNGLVPMQDEITTVPYSPLAMLLTLVAGLVLLLFLLATALRRLPSGMPLIGSNSLAISAACHPPLGLDQSEREEMVLRPLHWGAVPRDAKLGDLGIRNHHDAAAHGFRLDESNEGDDDFVGHCCFSDGMLEAPERGKFYA